MCDSTAIQCGQTGEFQGSIPIFSSIKEEEKFQQNVSVIYRLEEFTYLLDIMVSVYNKVSIIQPISNVLYK